MDTEGAGTGKNIADRVVDDYSGFKVYDERGEKLGKVEYTVLDHDEQPQYLGVNTGFFGTKTTLLPEELVHLDNDDRSFSAQTSESKVKDAPTLDSNDDISSDYEGRLRDHYGLGTGSDRDDERHRDERRSEGDRGEVRDEHHDHSREESRHEDRHHEDRPRDDVRSEGSERSDHSTASGAAAGAASGSAASSMDRDSRTEARDIRDTESRDTESRDTESRDTESRDTESRDTGSDHSRTSRQTSGGDREQIRVTLKREKARAERVIGSDGEEEVRIRKTTVSEETLVDVEDTE